MAVSPPCYTHCPFTKEEEKMVEIYLDRSGTIDEEAQAEDTTTKTARMALLSQWMEEDRQNGNYSLPRTMQRWRDDVVRRMKAQNILLPARIKLPRCLMAANGLTSQSVWIEDNQSVKIALQVRGKGWQRGIELVPAPAQ